MLAQGEIDRLDANARANVENICNVRGGGRDRKSSVRGYIWNSDGNNYELKGF